METIIEKWVASKLIRPFVIGLCKASTALVVSHLPLVTSHLSGWGVEISINPTILQAHLSGLAFIGLEIAQEWAAKRFPGVGL